MNDGGPAFPGKICTGHIDDAPIYEHPYGMSLRDYFAGQALAGIIFNIRPSYTNTDIATTCYSMADAMLAERKGK